MAVGSPTPNPSPKIPTPTHHPLRQLAVVDQPTGHQVHYVVLALPAAKHRHPACSQQRAALCGGLFLA